MYEARIISNEFVKLARSEGRMLNIVQIQILLFMAHGFALGVHDIPIISNEQFVAHSEGPILPNFYTTLNKKFSFNNIGEINPLFRRHIEVDERTLRIIKNMWNTYKDYSSEELTTKVKSFHFPWKMIWNEGEGYNQLISNELIGYAFKLLLAEIKEKTTPIEQLKLEKLEENLSNKTVFKSLGFKPIVEFKDNYYSITYTLLPIHKSEKQRIDFSIKQSILETLLDYSTCHFYALNLKVFQNFNAVRYTVVVPFFS